MCQFFVWHKTQLFRRYSQFVYPPCHTRIHPHFVLRFVIRWIYKILHFGLFKFTHTENKSAWGNFITKRLANLGNTEWQFMRFGIQNIFKVRICCCRGFWAQICVNCTIGRCANGQSHHQLICAWFSDIRAATIVAFGHVFHFILAHAGAALFTFNQWVGKARFVARIFPQQTIRY